ncbi:heterogeneous nuclear ribonucleoprotein L-like [Platysternon megacephalum]|uniref:Heterogeneous nuclear ribonucleoprotein L-like n=1 Tax=Platysternon megacephalum TaxID=55544 RepID=A0A4D9DZN1_9SAUR|nr:heterogeneous nuclear ribonucleoprotein L-like [Platysternon megacephalum]
MDGNTSSNALLNHVYFGEGPQSLWRADEAAWRSRACRVLHALGGHNIGKICQVDLSLLLKGEERNASILSTMRLDSRRPTDKPLLSHHRKEKHLPESPVFNLTAAERESDSPPQYFSVMLQLLDFVKNEFKKMSYFFPSIPD